MSVVRWTVWKSSGQITYRDLARTLYLSFLSERGTIEDISATWKRICQFLASLPLRISVRNPLCHQSLESYVPRCLHLQELLSKWVGPCRLIFCIWKKPLDQYAFEQTNMTGTDDQLHHWFGASGRLHGHFNVQDCIFYKWSGLFFFTSQPFCCQGLETSSANAWKALMGCHWSHRLFQRKTMHRVFFLGQVHDLQRWERQADSKDFWLFDTFWQLSSASISAFFSCTTWIPYNCFWSQYVTPIVRWDHKSLSSVVFAVAHNRIPSVFHVFTIGCADDAWWRQGCRDRVCSSLWLRISRCPALTGLQASKMTYQLYQTAFLLPFWHSISWDKSTCRSQTESKCGGG